MFQGVPRTELTSTRSARDVPLFMNYLTDPDFLSVKKLKSLLNVLNTEGGRRHCKFEASMGYINNILSEKGNKTKKVKNV